MQVCTYTLWGPQRNPLKCEITVNTLKYGKFAELKILVQVKKIFGTKIIFIIKSESQTNYGEAIFL